MVEIIAVRAVEMRAFDVRAFQLETFIVIIALRSIFASLAGELFGRELFDILICYEVSVIA